MHTRAAAAAAARAQTLWYRYTILRRVLRARAPMPSFDRRVPVWDLFVSRYTGVLTKKEAVRQSSVRMRMKRVFVKWSHLWWFDLIARRARDPAGCHFRAQLLRVALHAWRAHNHCSQRGGAAMGRRPLRAWRAFAAARKAARAAAVVVASRHADAPGITALRRWSAVAALHAAAAAPSAARVQGAASVCLWVLATWAAAARASCVPPGVRFAVTAFRAWAARTARLRAWRRVRAAHYAEVGRPLVAAAFAAWTAAARNGARARARRAGIAGSSRPHGGSIVAGVASAASKRRRSRGTDGGGGDEAAAAAAAAEDDTVAMAALAEDEAALEGIRVPVPGLCRASDATSAPLDVAAWRAVVAAARGSSAEVLRPRDADQLAAWLLRPEPWRMPARDTTHVQEAAATAAAAAAEARAAVAALTPSADHIIRTALMAAAAVAASGAADDVVEAELLRAAEAARTVRSEEALARGARAAGREVASR